MVRVSSAASLWVMAVVLMVVATVDQERLVLAGWAVLAGLGGTVFLAWHLCSIERVRVETICHLLFDAEEREGLRSM